MVENHDWSRSLGDSLDETIQKSGIRSALDQGSIPKRETDIVQAVRWIVAAELCKVAWSFNARTELQAPNNIAYFLEQRAKAITEATLSWHVTVGFEDDDAQDSWTETYPLDSYELAVTDARRVRASAPYATSTHIWYGAKTHG